MKAKVTRSELKECVKNALERVLSEGRDSDFGKGGKKWDSGKKSKSDFFDGPSKHEKAKKGQFTKKDKGNKGNRNWADFGEDEE